MGKYVFAYKGGSMAETPEAQAEVMAAWQAWGAELGDSLVDFGNPFSQTRILAASGEVTVGENSLTGYSVISADDIDAAVAKAKGCPGLSDDTFKVIVGEAIEM